MVFSRAHHDTAAAAARPEAFHGTTQRDIHVSEEGQSLPPEGPNTATRIAVWRPIPEKINIRREPEHTEAQKAQLSELKVYVERELLLPESDPYAKWERRFLANKDTYPRYMRASKWSMPEAQRRIKETLEWRRAYKPDLIPPTEIAEEVIGGKVVVNGFDVHGRPIVWLRPSRENTKPSPTQIRHLIWQLERAIDIMPEGVEKLALVVDYKGATSSNNPPVSTAKEVIHILQNHYCERLGRAVVINVPWYLNGFFSMLKPFLDPATKDKIKFNPEMTDLVVTEQLDSEFGGEHQYHYDSRVYFPALCSYCGIKEDGTREEEEEMGHGGKERRPEEIQRKLTSRYEGQEDMAAQAREQVNQQERQMPVQETVEPQVVQEEVVQVPAEMNPTYESAVPTVGEGQGTAISGTPAYTTGAAGMAGASGVGAYVAMMHMQNNKQTEVSHTEVPTTRDYATQPSETRAVVPEQTASVEAVEPVQAAPVQATEPVHAAPIIHVTEASEQAPVHSGPVEEEERELESSPAPTVEEEREVARSPAPVAEEKREAESTPANTSSLVPTPALLTENSAHSAPPASAGTTSALAAKPAPASKAGKKQKGGLMSRLKSMCCGSKGAQDTYQEKEKPVPGAVPVAPVTPAVVEAPTESDNTTLVAEPSKNKVRIAPEAAESKPYTNAPLPTNATFGPEAYQTAMETSEADDYFASDMRKAEAKPHHEGTDDAKLVTRPSDIMQRLHTGGSGDLVLAFEVKQPPKEVVEDGIEQSKASTSGA